MNSWYLEAEEDEDDDDDDDNDNTLWRYRFFHIVKYDGSGTGKIYKILFETRYLAEKISFKSSYLTILSTSTQQLYIRVICVYFFRKWKCSYHAMHMVHFLFWTVFQFKSSLFIPVMMIAVLIPLQQIVYIFFCDAAYTLKMLPLLLSSKYICKETWESRSCLACLFTDTKHTIIPTNWGRRRKKIQKT